MVGECNLLLGEWLESNLNELPQEYLSKDGYWKITQVNYIGKQDTGQPELIYWTGSVVLQKCHKIYTI